MRPAIVLLLTLAVAAVLWRACAAGTPDPAAPPPGPGDRPDPDDGEDRLRPSLFHIDHDRFLPATDPKVMPAAEAGFLEPEDEVYGVLLGGQARAYPVRMIAYHHVVNDRMDGVPIAVTY